MGCLPVYGKIECGLCHNTSQPIFNRTTTSSTDEKWRITANSIAWGSDNPAVVVLGFSKGGNAVQALNNPRKTLEDIPYAGNRHWVARILHAVKLLRSDDPKALSREFASGSGLFHFGSLVRCTVEQKVARPDGSEQWVSSGNGMLEGFSEHEFGRQVIDNCTRRFLGNLPSSVKLIVLFGLGRNLDRAKGGYRPSYVENVQPLLESALGKLEKLNELAYYNDKVTVIHVEHFAEPSHASSFVEPNGKRSHLRRKAIEAVRFAMNRIDKQPG